MQTEPEYQPPFELFKTDSGIDGHDATTWLVARFSTFHKAEEYLARRGYTFFDHGSYYHHDITRRNTMNHISYAIRDAKPKTPILTDPL